MIKRRAKRKPDTSDAVLREASIRSKLLHDYFYGRLNNEQTEQTEEPCSARCDSARRGRRGQAH